MAKRLPTDRWGKSRDIACRLGTWLLLAFVSHLAPASGEGFRESDVYDSEAAAAQRTTPEAALQSIEAPKGFRVTLFASEPTVRQPIGITTDPRGRLWVAENYTYAESPQRFDAKLRDRIVILEDADHDGKADRRTVFWDEAVKLTSVEVGLGGVWALCAPNLLFIPDADGDDRPDGPPQVILDGWDQDEVQHNIVNGLRWGPDGWLYGRHGILRTSLVGSPGTPDSDRTPINCGIWRYHPRLKIFEVVARGTTNSWGMDWDENGQLFFINTVIGHLWHVVPGAHYERMYGEDFDPHLYELISQTADHYHWDRRERWLDIRKLGVTPTTDAAGGGHAHSGLLIYQGDNWPDPYRGNVFMINFHGRRLNQDRLEREGAGYVARHESDLLRFGDPWFRGIDLRTGADGSVYVSDWSDTGECHDADGVDRNSGRIFQVAYGEPRAPEHADLSRLPSVKLVELLTHRNVWYARRARRVLHDRFAAGGAMEQTHEQLQSLFESSASAAHRLQALWTLHVTEGDDVEWLTKQLVDPSEHVRTWAAKLLLEPRHASRIASGKITSNLTKLAARDASGLVALFLASGLQRLPLEERWPLLSELAQRNEWANDPTLPLMIWYGMEEGVCQQPEKAIALACETDMGLLRRHVARRLAAELPAQSASVESLLSEVVETTDLAWQRDVLGGVATALKGRRSAPMPQIWPAVWDKAVATNDAALRQSALEAAVVFGDERATSELRRIIDASDRDAAARSIALASLVASRSPGLAGLLHGLIDDPDLSLAALRGLAAVDDEATPRIVLERYAAMDGTHRKQAIGTLASRATFARALLSAVEAGAVGADEIGAFEIRQMASFGEESIREKIAQLWPDVRPTSEAKSDAIRRYQALLSEERLQGADASQGRAVFQKSCASCHRLFGEGGEAGPDLTGGQRSNLYYLLHNIIDPNSEVAENFRMSVVVLDSGRVVNGVALRKTEHTIDLQTATELLTVDRDEIVEIGDSTLSLMPEQILNALTDEQICDLVAYLRSPLQVPLPKSTDR